MNIERCGGGLWVRVRDDNEARKLKKYLQAGGNAQAVETLAITMSVAGFPCDVPIEDADELFVKIL